jgi:CBS domain-containing protein/gamma-glutamylcysteine synthetase
VGDQNITNFNDQAERQQFTKCLLNDIKAFERMLNDNLFEHEILRIGAEQEMVLVGPDWMPALTYDKILAELNDPNFTTELGRFNLEINLDPIPFHGDAFSRMQHQLEEKMAKVRDAAAKFGTRVLLTGILPTIDRAHLVFENMTPNPRYKLMNDLIKSRRDADFEVSIRGIDELVTSHPNILFEACNTSFQVHMQLTQHEYVHKYNWAQAIAGPVMAASANSPLLMGRRLWKESRIALFQQSIDTRNTRHLKRDTESRVSFGKSWLYKSPAEIYHNNISRFNAMFSSETSEQSLDVLAEGGIPKLKALCLHNGTVYMWNRTCYGVSDTGKPHLRIENRYLPSGPTTLDEMANAAFWLGLMAGIPEHQEINTQMDFEDVRYNFYAGAQLGMDANFKWMGKSKSAKDILLTKFLPWAYEGLQSMKIDQHDIDRLLSVVVNRVQKRQNGATWMLRNYTSLLPNSTRAEASVSITRALHTNESTGAPVHLWPDLESSHSDGHKHFYLVNQIMDSDIATVQEDDLVELALNIMVWRNVRYVAVENDKHQLVGLLASRILVRLLKEGWQEHLTVGDVMVRDIVTVPPDMPTGDAIALLSQRNIGCLPVVSEDRLIGMVTERDIVKITDLTKKFKREW